eukprot:Hpha_TRINITY_DN11008_c0_g1::TRINITY_DN11008_c0_g1_i2::g.92837::m.92837
MRLYPCPRPWVRVEWRVTTRGRRGRAKYRCETNSHGRSSSCCLWSRSVTPFTPPCRQGRRRCSARGVVTSPPAKCALPPRRSQQSCAGPSVTCGMPLQHVVTKSEASSTSSAFSPRSERLGGEENPNELASTCADLAAALRSLAQGMQSSLRQSSVSEKEAEARVSASAAEAEELREALQKQRAEVLPLRLAAERMERAEKGLAAEREKHESVAKELQQLRTANGELQEAAQARRRDAQLLWHASVPIVSVRGPKGKESRGGCANSPVRSLRCVNTSARSHACGVSCCRSVVCCGS